MCATSDILGNWFEFEIVFNARISSKFEGNNTTNQDYQVKERLLSKIH